MWAERAHSVPLSAAWERANKNGLQGRTVVILEEMGSGGTAQRAGRGAFMLAGSQGMKTKPPSNCLLPIEAAAENLSF